MKKRTILVTSALPYANGHLHLGHLVEHIQTDIWVRTNKMLGHKCISVCGDDAHGTPIMLKAQQLNQTPEELTNYIKASHEADFHAFNIQYDCYHTTHSEENKNITQDIYKKLLAQGDIIQESINQAFDTEKQMFLPDRYVRGTCPKCHASDQYGDNCEACGATYHPTDLINPISALSGTPPIEKQSEHYFFNLPKYENYLKEWTKAGHLQSEMANKLDEWFQQGLKTWDISRDAPYFGFLIPGTTQKYFYVWLDAPIGYMASFLKYCENDQAIFEKFWSHDSQVELYHFVGKDILYFHALFWPALLHAAGYRTPTSIFTHGFLTINGQKMSKSRGTFIEARHYLKHLDPQYLRYYFAAKLNGKTEDLDLNFDDFTKRINADLVGKVVNIASRSASFIHKYFNGKLAHKLHNEDLYNKILEQQPRVIQNLIERDYALAIRNIMECTDWINQYIDMHKPWSLIKQEGQEHIVHEICTTSLNLFKLIITMLKPILPDMAQASEKFLNIKPLSFELAPAPLLDHQILAFEPLIQRVDPKNIQALLHEGNN